MELAIDANAFSNWPRFERELRAALSVTLPPEAVDRVMDRTLHAYEAMRLANLVQAVPPEHGRQIRRREAWDKDFQLAQMKMLSLLIESFVTLESPVDKR